MRTLRPLPPVTPDNDRNAMATITQRGVTFGQKPTGAPAPTDFRQSLAVVVGIDDYGNGIPRLSTAVSDARRLAAILRHCHGYRVRLLTRGVTRERLLRLLQQEIKPTGDDRLLFYFAGHGDAKTDESDESGPQGFLLLQDARAHQPDSYLPMTELRKTLRGLACRHLLAILDCCFAGAFNWSDVTRAALPDKPPRLYRERYERYVRYSACQALTSAAYDETARDVAFGEYIGRRREVVATKRRKHSPFALALFDGLLGAADLVGAVDLVPAQGDGIITALELFEYLRQRVERAAGQAGNQEQTPGLWPLSPKNKGEYVFLVPGKTPALPPAPELTAKNNPYRGLKPFATADAPLFFGRAKLTDSLAALVEQEPLVIVVGVSGSGKSSLVNAGLIPRLTRAGEPPGAKAQLGAGDGLPWRVLGPLRPGATPLTSLLRLLQEQLPETDARLLAGQSGVGGIDPDWLRSHPQERRLLVVDQFEEVITECRDHEERRGLIEQLVGLVAASSGRLHVVLTLRLDYEPQVRDLWDAGQWLDRRRFIVTPMKNDDLREAIERPATERVLYFEPPDLVQRIVDDVQPQRTPAALPLVSCILNDLYRLRDPDNRALTEETYDQLGGIVGVPGKCADQEYGALAPAEQATLRRLMLRMVALEGDELTPRRVFQSELDFGDPAENARVATVRERLTQARLIVGGAGGNPWGETEAHWELAHDALLAWEHLREWCRDSKKALELQSHISQAAGDWDRAPDHKAKAGLIWDYDRLRDAAGLLRCDHLAASPESPTVPRRHPARVGVLGAMIVKVWRSFFPDLTFPQNCFILNRLETQFVIESIRRKAKRLRSRVVISVVTITALAVVAIVTAVLHSEVERQRRETNAQQLVAERKGRETIAQRQASEAQDLNNEYPIRALLLAIEAVKRPLEADGARLGDAESLLRELLESTGGIPLQGSSALAFDPKGERLATGGKNGAVWLYEAGELKDPGRLEGHEGEVTALAFSPKGRWLAAGGGDQDGTVQLWDVADVNAQSVHRLRGHKGLVGGLAFAPGGRWLATVGVDGEVLLWDLNDPHPSANPMPLLGQERTTSVLAFDPKGKWLAILGSDDTVRLWDLDNDNPGPIPSRTHIDRVATLQFDPQGKWLATLGSDGTVRLWDQSRLNEEGAEPTEKTDPTAGGETLVFNPQGRFDPQGRWLATWSEGQTARLWDLEHPETPRPRVLRELEHVPNPLAFDPQGRWLAAAGKDNVAWLWDLRHPQADPQPLKGHKNKIVTLAFYPQGQLLATGSMDRTVRLWNPQHPKAEPQVLRGHEGAIMALAFSPNGPWLCTKDSNDSVRRWDISSPSSDPLLLGGRANQVAIIATDLQGRWLAAGDWDGNVRLWNLAHPRAAPELLCGDQRRLSGEEPAGECDKSRVETLGFGPRGRWLAIATESGTRLLDLDDPDARPIDYGGGAFAFHPDGRRLATEGSDDTVLLWDLDKRREEQRPVILCGEHPASGAEPVSPCASAVVRSLGFDPQGRRLAVIGKDDRAQLLDLADLRRTPTLIDHYAKALAFSPLGRQLATGGVDGVRLWDLGASEPKALAMLCGDKRYEPSEECPSLTGQEEPVTDVGFDGSGRWLAVGSRLGTARLWDLESPNAKPVRLCCDSQKWVETLALDPRGSWLGIGISDGTVRLWDLVHTNIEPVSLTRPIGADALDFKPLGHWFPVTGADGVAQLRNIANPSEGLAPLGFFADEVGIPSIAPAFAFDPQGRWLATGDNDGTVRLWQLDIKMLIDLACRTAGRNLDREKEWHQDFGDYRETCELGLR